MCFSRRDRKYLFSLEETKFLVAFMCLVSVFQSRKWRLLKMILSKWCVCKQIEPFSDTGFHWPTMWLLGYIPYAVCLASLIMLYSFCEVYWNILDICIVNTQWQDAVSQSNHSHPLALRSLASMYRRGLGCQQDDAAAIPLCVVSLMCYSVCLCDFFSFWSYCVFFVMFCSALRGVPSLEIRMQWIV